MFSVLEALISKYFAINGGAIILYVVEIGWRALEINRDYSPTCITRYRGTFILFRQNKCITDGPT